MLSFGIKHRAPVALTTRRMSVRMMAKAKGSVKWFDATKGFGFIINEAGGPDLFVHQTAIQASGFRTLADGEAVEFDIEVGSDNKQRAVNVTGPNGQNVQGAPKREYYERDERSDYSPRRGGGGGGGYNRRNNDRY